MIKGKTLLAFAPWVLALALALPIAAGLAGTLAPALRGQGFTDLAAWQGLGCAVRLSLGTGLGSTLLALGITILIVAALQGTRGFATLRHSLSPLLALPHAAAALGLAFLISPSGWIARALSPWATGWTSPPDILILNDPMGLALTLGLVAKEVPFLLLMALAALPQCDAQRRGLMAANLGYGRVMGFALSTLPALYRALRLPSFAVLAYAMTNVDMAMILGPNLPPPLAVQITDWMTDPSLRHMPTAAAGALLQLALVAGVLALWLGVERLLAPALPALALMGRRSRALTASWRLWPKPWALPWPSALAQASLALGCGPLRAFGSFPPLCPIALALPLGQRHCPI